MSANYSDLSGVTGTSFKIGKATVAASGVSTTKTFTLPDTSGTFALIADIPSGTRFIDGGAANSTYTVEQVLDGGGSGSF